MDNIIALIFLGIVLIFIWVFYWWFYWQYRVDKTRQELFFLRNAGGEISFNHPAYGILRNVMNSMIRFTHKVEPITLCCLYIAVKLSPPPSNDFTTTFKKELGTITSDTAREKITDFHVRMNHIVIGHLIKSSISVMLVTVILIIYVLLRQGRDKVMFKVNKQFPGIKQIDNMAAELG